MYTTVHGRESASKSLAHLGNDDEPGVDGDVAKALLMHGRESASKSPAHLGNDDEPGVDGDVAEAFLQGALHVGGGAVREPERQQAQDVLQVGPLRRLACRASTALGICRR